ncbi:MAG: hypothetical protein O3C60_14655 [Planctomycetota bacterium]|nr:hypothetical protein [Planctomycetota bacterium]
MLPSLRSSPAFHAAAVALDDRQQDASLVLRAGVVATTQHGIFQITILIEQEQRVVAAALDVTAVGGHFLVALGFAH